MIFIFKIISSLLLLISPVAEAKTFSTSYVQFELPDSWHCSRIDQSWACQVQGGSSQRQSILILTAKQAGPQDHLAGLKAQLKTPQAITGARRTTLTSQLQWEKDVTLDQQPWVESLHLNREIENFYTYYLATVARGLTIVLSFSFQSDKSKELEPVLAQLRSSLKLIAAPLATAKSAAPVGPLGTFEQTGPENKHKSMKTLINNYFFWIILAVLASLAGLFIALRRK